VGYNSGLLNVKVLNDQAAGYHSWVASGITWAADHGARVINMSLGWNSGSKTLENAVNYAWNKGVVLACAGGNDGNTRPTYPAKYDRCIAVAATDANDRKASFSSYGSKWMDVAGLAALLWGTSYGSSNQAVRERIESTADRIAGMGGYWAYGRINACKAVGGVCN